MEIVIKDSQKRVRVNHRKIKRILGKALKYLEGSNKLPVTSNKLKNKKESENSSLEVSVLFVSDRRMRTLNVTYRGIDRTTDVLSFPQYDSNELNQKPSANSLPVTRHPLLPLGDIVISPVKARSQAGGHGTTFYEEVSRLLIHGLLHLLGYEHEENAYQARKMRKMEEELIENLKSKNKN